MFTSLRAARIATFLYFALNGFVLGIWVVHIPSIEHHVGITHATLGWLLLLLGGGAFLGMQVCGPLTDRFGARLVVPVSAVLMSLTLVLPGVAANGWMLGAALLAFGFGNGCMDVSMNAHAVQVEAAYERPVMSAFHAMFSVGGVLAALVAARTLSWGWSPATTMTGVAVIGLVLGVVSWRGLLPPAVHDAEPADGSAGAPAGAPTTASAGAASAGAASGAPAGKAGWRSTPLKIWVLAALALMLFLSEGVAADWSALAMRDVLDASPATAAFAYGAFATAMTVGRFLVDRIAARFGPVAVLRWGSVIAAVAMVLVIVAPSVPVALVGWTLFGVGLSGTIPQLFSAAGHHDPRAAATNMSRVAGLGYLGMLAGPAVIGALTHITALNYTFVLPVAFCVIAAVTAPMLRDSRSPRHPEPVASTRR